MLRQQTVHKIFPGNQLYTCMYEIKINKANTIMAVIRRSFTTLNQNDVAPLYKVLVRSNLDYAIYILWYFYKHKYKVAIENVQRGATK